MNEFTSTLKAEFKKFKYTNIIHLAYLLPIIAILLSSLIMDKFIRSTGQLFPSYGSFFNLLTGMNIVFLMPFILPVIANRICKIDYRDNTLENLNHSGDRYFRVFLSKLVLAFGSITLILNLFYFLQLALYQLISSWGYAPKYFDFGVFVFNFLSINSMAICLLPYLLIHQLLSAKFQWNVLSILVSVVLYWTSLGIEFNTGHNSYHLSPYIQDFAFLLNIPENCNIFTVITPWYSVGISLLYSSIILSLIYLIKDSIFTNSKLLIKK